MPFQIRERSVLAEADHGCCRYLHRGKMRCRRWMIGTLIPQTRELLQHVRKLSQLAGDDDTLARARARRARRALKVQPSQDLLYGRQPHILHTFKLEFSCCHLSKPLLSHLILSFPCSASCRVCHVLKVL